MSGAVAIFGVAAALRLAVPAGYAEGAPPGFSGGFGEDSCHACHFHAEPNAGGGRVTIDGLPAAYAPGGRYALTVRLTRAGMRVAGFQMTARFTDGGRQAGSLEPGPAEPGRVAVETQGGLAYAGQKKAGAAPNASDTATWTVIWTAPASGSVVFSVAANAADGDGTAEGDYVYTAAIEIAPREPRESPTSGPAPSVSPPRAPPSP
ncbi:MAG: choice-of-anchor V domain-containing protein [Acidobacteriota bacterium]